MEFEQNVTMDRINNEESYLYVGLAYSYAEQASI